MDLSAHACSLPNLRDLTSLTPHLRRHLIYRSAAPTAASPAALAALRITTVFDLRSETELARTLVVVPPPAGVTRLPVPVFAREDYTPEAIARRYAAYAATDTVAGFVRAYRAILRAGGPAFAHILRHVAAPAGPTPCLVHCTAGKDRTGVLCAIVLALCGVDDETIAREYALTEEGLRGERARIVARLREAPALDGDAEAAERMLSSRPESMLETLKMLREEYGSVEDYVINVCGLSKEEIAGIRRNLGADTQAPASSAL
ncbi:Tyrosine-protein phosphatase [Tolypocladium ophioglossoides CBS 100239]|uniref:Tyrosine-protein phosphatase n=1 Tax=Tolypocladium ophioglossoides (strain CBS 100239) TaxID=1163406 RepID=A0A0L0N1P2_TOLOC|nr:Tyrosine-protein phosphatase [Tolypocladium ophioglossoides CBS 100239]